MRQEYGGSWTEKKLKALKDYLCAYMTLMKGNPSARHFRPVYLDGFAGSGRRYATPKANEPGLLEEFGASEAVDFYKGSARIALELDKPFDKYIFVEIDPQAADDLKAHCAEFPALNTRVVRQDANEFIKQWSASLERHDRALVFLDPYGMQVDWTTIEALAKTQKVDLWVLVPLGQAIVRLLTQQQPPTAWANALTRFFGSDGWRDHFYAVKRQTTLFGEQEAIKREVDFGRVTAFIIGRLKTIFEAVLDTPVVLRNSTGNPLYLLCFAASNPKGAKTAIKIAKDIARKLNDGG